MVDESSRSSAGPKAPVRILVVDDFAPWRLQIRSTLETRLEYLIVSEASDGLEAVQKTARLHPDLILLDLTLPKLNGIEAARRIRRIAPTCKILFLSQETSADLVREALDLGALGYLAKSSAGPTLLLKAIDALLEGRQFVHTGQPGTDPADAEKK